MLDGTDESVCWLEADSGGGIWGDDDGGGEVDRVILSKSIMSCSLEVLVGAG